MERRRAERELKVLVVDDEDDLRELLDMSLARMGLHASLAGSVGEARELLGKERFALCLTDMRLPDGEGMELVRSMEWAVSVGKTDTVTNEMVRQKCPDFVMSKPL